MHFSFPNYGMVIKQVSPKVFVAKKMHREKRRYAELDFRVEGEYILLCSVFHTWKNERKLVLQKGGVTHRWVTRSCRRGRETSESAEQLLLPDLSSFDVLLHGKSG